MTTTSFDGTPAAPPATLTVLLSGWAVRLAPGLQQALATRTWTRALVWDLVCENAPNPPASVEIVVCAGPPAVRALRTRWPHATVVALVSARDSGTETVAGLHAGADVCIRGEDTDLIAAHMQSVVRRLGLLDDGTPR